MLIWWSTPATQQLAAAHEYIAADDEAAAIRITNHIWDSVDILARHPFAGRKGRVAGYTRVGYFGHAVRRGVPD